jgi:hypothetical protein
MERIGSTPYNRTTSRRNHQALVTGQNVRTRSLSINFSPDSFEQNKTLRWSNGMDAVILSVTHTDIVANSSTSDLLEGGGGYGLYLMLYAFNRGGNNSFFHGCKFIKLGDAASGQVRWRRKQIDCDDIVLKLHVEDITYHSWPNNRYKSKGFSGKLKATVYLEDQTSTGTAVPHSRVTSTNHQNYAEPTQTQGSSETSNSRFISYNTPPQENKTDVVIPGLIIALVILSVLVFFSLFFYRRRQNSRPMYNKQEFTHPTHSSSSPNTISNTPCSVCGAPLTEGSGKCSEVECQSNQNNIPQSNSTPTITSAANNAACSIIDVNPLICKVCGCPLSEANGECPELECPSRGSFISSQVKSNGTEQHSSGNEVPETCSICGCPLSDDGKCPETDCPSSTGIAKNHHLNRTVAVQPQSTPPSHTLRTHTSAPQNTVTSRRLSKKVILAALLLVVIAGAVGVGIVIGKGNLPTLGGTSARSITLSEMKGMIASLKRTCNYRNNKNVLYAKDFLKQFGQPDYIDRIRKNEFYIGYQTSDKELHLRVVVFEEAEYGKINSLSFDRRNNFYGYYYL